MIDRIRPAALAVATEPRDGLVAQGNHEVIRPRRLVAVLFRFGGVLGGVLNGVLDGDCGGALMCGNERGYELGYLFSASDRGGSASTDGRLVRRRLDLFFRCLRWQLLCDYGSRRSSFDLWLDGVRRLKRRTSHLDPVDLLDRLGLGDVDTTVWQGIRRRLCA